MSTARTLLQVAGLCCFPAAAWFAFGIVGILVTTGVVLLVLEYLLGKE